MLHSRSGEQAMWKTGLLIVQLFAAGTPPPEPARRVEIGPGGVSCTYQRCMMRCTKLNGLVCHSYCEGKIRERRAIGVCPANG
jgi:hypothetical protein